MRWISVHERLPENAVDVLAWGKRDWESKPYVIMAWMSADCVWYDVDTEIKVRWWQPLPQSPEEVVNG